MASIHAMVLSVKVESEAEEWSCPTCGRRVLLRWSPSHQRTVLQPGDTDVPHIGGKGGAPAGELVLGAPLTAEERLWLSEFGICWDEASR